MTCRGLREDDRRLHQAAGDEKNHQALEVPEAIRLFWMDSCGKTKGMPS